MFYLNPNCGLHCNAVCDKDGEMAGECFEIGKILTFNVVVCGRGDEARRDW